MSAYLELAERCEAASVEQTASLLIEAFDATSWRSKFVGQVAFHNPEWMRFDKLIRAGAFVDAALTLVPDDLDWHGDMHWSHDNARTRVVTVQLRYWRVSARAGVAALALTAACLRARHAQEATNVR